MSKNLKLKLSIFMLFAVLLCTLFTVNILPANKTFKETKQSSEIFEYTVTLKNNKIVLLENDNVYKEYSANPALLSGEDLVLLSSGIKVLSVAEADSLLEDFDE